MNESLKDKYDYMYRGMSRDILEYKLENKSYLLNSLLNKVEYSKKLKPIPIKYSKIYGMLYTSGLIHELTELSRPIDFYFGYNKKYDEKFFLEYFLPDVAFLFLCWHGFRSYAKEFIESGEVDSFCMSIALKMAVYNDNLEMAKWLHGLFKVRSDHLSDCFCISVYKENFKIMKWLLSVSCKTHRNDFLEALRRKKYEGYKNIRLFVREWEKKIVKRIKNKYIIVESDSELDVEDEKNETNTSLIQTSDSEEQFIPPEPKVNISYRKKYTPTAKMIKFWGLDEKTKLSFIDIRKKFITYIETNKLNKNNTIKTDEKINFILGITKNTNINILYLENIVMHFFENNV